ncbi:MAG TPA: hypothetical protein VG435_19205 [Acidimicrobiales bacterium]|nr:hypothetical protein [Acidimicrobiales bacterium]
MSVTEVASLALGGDDRGISEPANGSLPDNALLLGFLNDFFAAKREPAPPPEKPSAPARRSPPAPAPVSYQPPDPDPQVDEEDDIVLPASAPLPYWPPLPEFPHGTEVPPPPPPVPATSQATLRPADLPHLVADPGSVPSCPPPALAPPAGVADLQLALPFPDLASPGRPAPPAPGEHGPGGPDRPPGSLDQSEEVPPAAPSGGAVVETVNVEMAAPLTSPVEVERAAAPARLPQGYPTLSASSAPSGFLPRPGTPAGPERAGTATAPPGQVAGSALPTPPGYVPSPSFHGRIDAPVSPLPAPPGYPISTLPPLEARPPDPEGPTPAESGRSRIGFRRRGK